tara:strand:- start:1563 stop:1991 length:429 start_codon:yes stop_codon:yes gene_type:complete
MATMTLSYNSQEIIINTDEITIVQTSDSSCGVKYTLFIDPDTRSSVYVEFTTSDSTTGGISPDANDVITDVTQYNVFLSTYQSSADSGIGNLHETTLTVNVRESSGGTILETFYLSRLSVNGQSCSDIVEDPGDDIDDCPFC